MLDLTIYSEFFYFYYDSLDYYQLRKGYMIKNMVFKFKGFQALESISSQSGITSTIRQPKSVCVKAVFLVCHSRGP